MKKLLFIITTLLPLTATSQIMWFVGGKGDGFGAANVAAFNPQTLTNHYPYIGGKSDGYTSSDWSSFYPELLSNFVTYAGGKADGYASLSISNFQPTSISNYYPYQGGNADGYAQVAIDNFQPGLINNYYPYMGGQADGYAMVSNQNFQPGMINNYYPYVGGIGDGWSNALNASYVLPVVLMSFDGEAMGDYNQLHWETSVEESLDYFLVEKSKNGVDFSDIGSVNAKGNSKTVQAYTYNDNENVQGASYYQLKMTDIDKSFKYSKVIKLINEKLDYTVLLAPNPATDLISIRFSRAMQATSNFSVLDMSGKVVLKSRIDKDEATKNIDVRPLAPGQYMIQLFLANDLISLPFIKN